MPRHDHREAREHTVLPGASPVLFYSQVTVRRALVIPVEDECNLHGDKKQFPPSP